MKRPQKLGLIAFGAWLLTLGLDVGSFPGGVALTGFADGRVSSVGTKNGPYWKELVEGERSSYMLGLMKVPHYKVGVPFLFTVHGAAMPASVDLFLHTDSGFEGRSFVIEKATLVYDGGFSHDIIFKGNPRSGILTARQREGRKFCRAEVAIPGCIAHKNNYTIEVHGFIENGEDDIRIREDVRVLYSEDRFVRLGWICLIARIFSQMSA